MVPLALFVLVLMVGEAPVIFKVLSQEIDLHTTIVLLTFLVTVLQPMMTIKTKSLQEIEVIALCRQ